MTDGPHRRLNQLTGEWILVSPHRADRPWQGQVEPPVRERPPRYDPDCYLCPGNARAGGHRTPAYDSTFVFDNDFPALLPEPVAEIRTGSPLLVAEAERGVCRVICYSPRHDLTLGEMSTAEITTVVDAWAGQYAELGGLPWVRHVQIFENRGAMTGASNPHPHGQVWAEDHLAGEAAKELRRIEASDGCLLCDYLAVELAGGERVILANEHFVALVPYWAMWPFEAMVLPRAHAGALTDLDPERRRALASLLRDLNRTFDGLFEVKFPYSMGFHQRPTDDRPYPGWHLHAHFYPPLLRSATVRKFFGGYELLGQPQRDLTPEAAAERLRAVARGPGA